jgi:hypothetical protein
VEAITVEGRAPMPRVFLSAAQGTGLDALRGLIAAQIKSGPASYSPEKDGDDLNALDTATTYASTDSGATGPHGPDDFSLAAAA